MSGITHTATVSATSTPAPRQDPTATPTPAQPPPVSQPEPSKPESPPPAKPPPKKPSEAAPPRSSRLAEQAEEREAQLQRMEADRNKRQLRTIFKHSRVVRRCLQYATKILDRFDVSGVL